MAHFHKSSRPQRVKPYLCTKFGDFSLKNESRNAKRGRLVKWSIMHIFNKGRTSIIELVHDLRALNILAKFQNDPWKFTDVRALTVIFRVRSCKMWKKFAKIFFCQLWKKPEFILINILSPTFVPNLVTLAWTRRSENDNTPQPLDQWMNSPFIGQQVGNCKSFTLTHYLADLFAMHRGPRSIPLCIQHHIQLISLSFQVSRPSHS